LSVEAFHDRLAPVEPAAVTVRPVGIEGGVVSAEGVAPTPLLLDSAPPVPLQPANTKVVVVTAEEVKFIRNIGISSLLGRTATTRTLACGMENQQTLNDMSLSYDDGM